MTGTRRALLAGAAVLAAGCSFMNRLDVCIDAPPDTRVNERGDQYEFSNHPRSAAALSNGRVLAAFSAQTWEVGTGDALTSEVRIALLELGTGDRLTLCNTGDRDRTISEPGTYAWGASVAPVDLTVAGQKAIALVAWTEGVALPDSVVRMRFVDGAGCPLAFAFRSYAAPALQGSIEWSEQRRAVLATVQDERSVYRTWVDAPSPSEPLLLATSPDPIYGYPQAAVAPDGTAIVTWSELGAGPRGILLDADGNPRPAAPSGGQTAPFPIAFPAMPEGVVFSSAMGRIAVREDRFTIGVQQRPTASSGVGRAIAREFGLDAAPLGPAFLLDGGDSAAQGSPALAYAPGGTLVAVWEARAAGGTVGRLFGDGGGPRFNAIACGDDRFVIGARAETIVGWPSVLVEKGRVFVVHNGEGAADPRGTATLAWDVAFADLWPGPQ